MIQCRRCGRQLGTSIDNTIEVLAHIRECGICPSCDGQGMTVVTQLDHDPNCVGDCDTCPMIVGIEEMCETCMGQGLPRY